MLRGIMKYYMLIFIVTINANITYSAVVGDDHKAQCGQRCVHFICMLHGVPLSIKQVCEVLPPKEDGESYYEVKRALEKIGFTVKAKAVTYEKLREEQFPIIAHYTDEHFIVIEKIESNSVSVFDIFKNRQIVTMEDFIENWDGTILSIMKSKNAKRMPIWMTKNENMNMPKIQFDSLFVDKGIVGSEQEEVLFTFPFESIGEGDLIVKDVKTDCGCTLVSYPKGTIRRGVKERICVKYRPGDENGPFGKTALVLTNDPIFPAIKLYIAGTTEKQLEIHPRKLYLPVQNKQGNFGEVFINYLGHEELLVTDTITDIDGLEIHVEKTNKEKLTNRIHNSKIMYPASIDYTNFYNIRYSYTSDLEKSEKIKGYIWLKTNLTKVPTIKLPIEVEIFSCIQMKPSLLFLGELVQGQDITQTVKMESKEKSEFKINSVAFEDCDFKYTCTEGYNIVHKLTFTSILQDVNMNVVDGIIYIEINKKGSYEKKVLKLPVYGYFGSTCKDR